MSGEVVLEVEELVKYFPLTAGRAPGARRGRQGGRRRLIRVAQGRDARHRRRVRLRQIDAGPDADRLEGPTGRHSYVQRRRHLLARSGAACALRRNMQIIFQDPYSSLNPRMTVGDIVGEPFDIHPDVGRSATGGVGCRSCSTWSASTPSTSTGTRTSSPAVSASGSGSPAALALGPKVIICDEPVSALDVSVQAQVVNLLEELQDEFGLTYIFIAHDLSVVRHISDRVGVMYLGQFVELGDRGPDLRAPGPPLHPGAAVRRAGARPARRTPGADHPGRRRAQPGRIRRAAAASAPAAGRPRRSAASTNRNSSHGPTGSLPHDSACHFAEPRVVV